MTGKYQTDNKDKKVPDRQKGQACTKQATRARKYHRQQDRQVL